MHGAGRLLLLSLLQAPWLLQQQRSCSACRRELVAPSSCKPYLWNSKIPALWLETAPVLHSCRSSRDAPSAEHAAAQGARPSPHLWDHLYGPATTKTCVYLLNGLNGPIAPSVTALLPRAGCPDVQPGEASAAAQVPLAMALGQPPNTHGLERSYVCAAQQRWQPWLRLAPSCHGTAGSGAVVARQPCAAAGRRGRSGSGIPTPLAHPQPRSPQQSPADHQERASPGAEPRQPALALPLAAGRSPLRVSSVPTCHQALQQRSRAAGTPQPPRCSLAQAAL